VWRDLRVLAHMEQALKQRGRRGLYLLVTSAGRVRTLEEVTRLKERYSWPADHHEGWPDLVGPESGFWRDMRVFNNPGRPGAGAIVAGMVNQFGFTHDRLGPDAPDGLTIADLRRAADVEFGQSTYEPFGIAQLEPLHAGAICVPSAVCGCVGYARREIGELGWTEANTRTLLVADYTADMPSDPLSITQAQRDEEEERVAAAVAKTLLDRLPKTWNDRRPLLEEGQQLAERMNWTRVCEEMFLPGLRSIVD